MSMLEQRLGAQEFVVTTEVAPPKGCDLSEVLATAAAIEGMTAINVTDNQGANMRMAPMAVAAKLVAAGIEPVLQVTCRDRNRLALQSDLLAASAFGIENILLLSGDHARFGDHPQARSVFDLDSVQLLQAVTTLKEGNDLAGRPLQGSPSFFAGAAVTPEAEPLELMLQKFHKKVASGARFFQTQAVFSTPRLEIFMAEASRCGTPVILGVLLLKSARMARFLNANIPGVRVPDAMIERLDKASVPLEEGVAIARELVAAARSYCQGVHLMTLGQETRIPDLLT
ncbi:MAG: 5,10-methylenetetrahydrofolate reductase [Desulfuromonas sp.]|nr:MAG: 5,10-methylenetetrahydrofolate reductase [Desulfuromonas sp.]